MNLLLLPVLKNKNQMLELQLMLLETVLTMLMCLQGNLLRGIDIKVESSMEQKMRLGLVLGRLANLGQS